MTKRGTVLLIAQALAFVEPELAADYEVIRAWESIDGEALDRVGALVCLGHQSADEYLDRLPALGLVACYTTGYDGIDLAELDRRGIASSHAPGATAPAVAEFALTQILAVFRNVNVGERLVRAGEWRSDAVVGMGRSLRRARVGILGLGAIGQALAELLEPFGTQVAWWGPRPHPELPWPRAGSLVELARDSDVLVICARAHAGNRGLVDLDVIEALGPDGLLVNVARGQLVDEDALIPALLDGRLGGAALDVFETEPTPFSRWKDVPNVLLTPHIGGGSIDSAHRMTALLLDNLDRFFAGSPLATPIPADTAGSLV